MFCRAAILSPVPPRRVWICFFAVRQLRNGIREDMIGRYTREDDIFYTVPAVEASSARLPPALSFRSSSGARTVIYIFSRDVCLVPFAVPARCVCILCWHSRSGRRNEIETMIEKLRYASIEDTQSGLQSAYILPRFAIPRVCIPGRFALLLRFATLRNRLG